MLLLVISNRAATDPPQHTLQMSFLKALFAKGSQAVTAAGAAARDAAAATSAAKSASAAAAAAAAAAKAAKAAREPLVLFPSDAFTARVTAANDAWLDEFWGAPLLPPSPAAPSASTSPSAASAPGTTRPVVHIFGTSLVNIPRLMPVPFSNNKRMQYDGERALESLMSRYQASGSLGGGISSGSDSDSSIDDQHIPSIHDQPAASHPKRVSILVDETLERGAWLLETYAPLVRSLLSSEFSGSNSALAVSGSDFLMGGKKRAPAVSMSAGLMVGIEQLRRNIRAARSVPERLDQVIDWATEQEELLVQAGVPGDWIDIMQTTGFIPGWDTAAFLESIMAYRQEYAADPVLREISPRVEALELVGLDAETLAAIVDGSGPFTGRGLTGSQEAAEAAPSGTLDATGATGEPGQAVAAMSMAERMMQVYESSGVPVPDFGRIRSGSMIVDGALQRLALDSEGMRRYVDVLASEVGMGASSGAGGVDGGMAQESDEGKQRLAQRVSEIAASAANLEHAIMRQMEEVPSDVVVVVAERPVAAILASRLGVPRVQEALALPSV